MTDEPIEAVPGDEHFQNLYRDLSNAITQGKSPDAANLELKILQEQLFGAYPGLLDTRLQALAKAHQQYLEQLNRVKYLQKRAIRFGREHWYAGPMHEDSLWERLAERLNSQLRSDEDIELVNADSTIVVSLLDNPSTTGFSTRGLVVGHVQSGKTGNMAAVIDKAADTQYKFFLLLSGMTDQLRNQTQLRLEADIVGLAPDRWMKWTAADSEAAKGDFSEKAVGGFSFDHRNQIAVIKKNAAVLRRFLAKLKNTDQATLRHTPFLIIDDECDQASVNSARYERAITKINDLIRQILRELPRAAYVGYTATPFANVLIDTTVPEDLYPRHFIHALKRPLAYFGAQELFGRHALDGEYEENSEGYDMIRRVPDEEIDLLRPPPGTGQPILITPTLEVAIRYFAMVIAARRVRGDGEKHNTMLLHTSVLNSVHQQTAAIVKPYVEHLGKQLAAKNKALLARCEKEWSDEQETVLSEQFDRQPISFAQIRPHLADVASSIDVHVENWRAVERLDYSDEQQTYIVIGGNVLPAA